MIRRKKPPIEVALEDCVKWAKETGLPQQKMLWVPSMDMIVTLKVEPNKRKRSAE